MEELQLFDTHAHLYDPRFDADRDAVLQRMKETGVARCVVVGATMETSRAARDLAEQHDFLSFAAGIHPHDAKDWREESAGELAELLAHPKAVALGEIGLDFHYDHSPREKQREVFDRQIFEGHRAGKPIILHVREAYNDTLDILRAARGHLPPFLVHCFSGSWETAKICLDMGAMVSIAGPVTFKNANKLLDVARHTPLDRLMVETDCPYLAPDPFRGKRNEPSYVRIVAEKIAEIRGISARELAEATYKNGMRFFGLSDA